MVFTHVNSHRGEEFERHITSPGKDNQQIIWSIYSWNLKNIFWLSLDYPKHSMWHVPHIYIKNQPHKSDTYSSLINIILQFLMMIHDDLREYFDLR